MAEHPRPPRAGDAGTASGGREPQFQVAIAGTNGGARRHAGPTHPLLALQRSAGNAAVASMLAGRRPAASSAAALPVAPAPVPEADGPAGALDVERLLATDVAAVGDGGGSAPPRGVAPTEPGPARSAAPGGWPASNRSPGAHRSSSRHRPTSTHRLTGPRRPTSARRPARRARAAGRPGGAPRGARAARRPDPARRPAHRRPRGRPRRPRPGPHARRRRRAGAPGGAAPQGWSDLPGAGLVRGAVDAVGDLAGAALDAVKGKISSLSRSAALGLGSRAVHGRGPAVRPR